MIIKQSILAAEISFSAMIILQRLNGVKMFQARSIQVGLHIAMVT